MTPKRSKYRILSTEEVGARIEAHKCTRSSREAAEHLARLGYPVQVSALQKWYRRRGLGWTPTPQTVSRGDVCRVTVDALKRVVGASRDNELACAQTIAAARRILEEHARMMEKIEQHA